MLHELLEDEVPESLKKILESDWQLVITKTLAPTGIMSADVLLNMDRIIDLEPEERPKAFKLFMDKVAQEARASGGRGAQTDEDVFSFDES